MKSLIVLYLLLTSNVFAGTTANLTLRGTVPAVISITLSAEAGATTLDLSSTATDLLVGAVDERSNSLTGYTISITSLNAGHLKNGTADQLAYTLKYDGVLVNLSSTSTAKTVFSGGVFYNTSNMEISYTGKAATDMVAGDYSDTLTVEISVN